MSWKGKAEREGPVREGMHETPAPEKALGSISDKIFAS